MHELSIAMGIVRIAEAEAKKARARKIEKIELEIGTLSGVEIDSLNFAWPMATGGTILEHAQKQVHIIEAIGRCADCGCEYPLQNLYDSCPDCGSFLKTVLKGKELRVKAIEVS